MGANAIGFKRISSIRPWALGLMLLACGLAQAAPPPPPLLSVRSPTGPIPVTGERAGVVLAAGDLYQMRVVAAQTAFVYLVRYHPERGADLVLPRETGWAYELSRTAILMDSATGRFHPFADHRVGADFGFVGIVENEGFVFGFSFAIGIRLSADAIDQAISIGFKPHRFQHGIGRNAFTPLDDSSFSKDNANVKHNTRVIGIAEGDHANAYAVSKLWRHEVANSFIGQKPIAAAY